MCRRQARALCGRYAHRLQWFLRGEYGSVDREREDRRVHACAMAQAGADNRSIRTVYGTDQLMKKLKLSGRSLMAAAALWPHEHTRRDHQAARLQRACACSPAWRRRLSRRTDEVSRSQRATASAAVSISPFSSTSARWMTRQALLPAHASEGTAQARTAWTLMTRP